MRRSHRPRLPVPLLLTPGRFYSPCPQDGHSLGAVCSSLSLALLDKDGFWERDLTTRLRDLLVLPCSIRASSLLLRLASWRSRRNTSAREGMFKRCRAVSTGRSSSASLVSLSLTSPPGNSLTEAAAWETKSARK